MLGMLEILVMLGMLGMLRMLRMLGCLEEECIGLKKLGCIETEKHDCVIRERKFYAGQTIQKWEF
jgi:hypothetical protein